MMYVYGTPAEGQAHYVTIVLELLLLLLREEGGSSALGENRNKYEGALLVPPYYTRDQSEYLVTDRKEGKKEGREQRELV